MADWLADAWDNAVSILGLAFTLWGTVLAWLAATEDYKTYGGEPLFPRLTAINDWIKRVILAINDWIKRVILRMKPNQAVSLGSGTGSFTFTGTGSGTSDREVSEDAPLDEQVRYLRERLAALRSEVGSVRESIGDAERRLTTQIRDVHADSQRRDEKLNEQIRNVATGTIKRELKGLVLVGVGSVMSAVPALIS